VLPDAREAIQTQRVGWLLKRATDFLFGDIDIRKYLLRSLQIAPTRGNERKPARRAIQQARAADAP
jgi:hypothetical protein